MWPFEPVVYHRVCFLSCGSQGESMNFEIVMSGLESVQISLTIMTGSSMAKQIYKEEVHSEVTQLEIFCLLTELL